MTSAKKRILFVDDQPELLSGLQRVLRSRRTIWEMQFAESGEEALKALEASSFDVIVSDMRMPVMDGAALLQEVMVRKPETMRIMLTGQADEEQVLRALAPTHRFLSKPCPPTELIGTLERVLALREILVDGNVHAMVSGVQNLPSIPRIYQELMDAVLSPEADVKRISEIISQDLSMSCQILRFVNSGFFALNNPIDDVSHGAALIGLNRLRPLILSAGILSQFHGTMPANLTLEGLTSHCLATGIAAKHLMSVECPGEEDRAADAALAGMVHDLGYLVALQNPPSNYVELLESLSQKSIQMNDAETRQFYAFHDQLGGYLLGLWGFPEVVVDAIMKHHGPFDQSQKEFCEITALHISNALVHEILPGSTWPFGAKLDCDYLQAVGVEDRIDSWRSEIRDLIDPRK